MALNKPTAEGYYFATHIGRDSRCLVWVYKDHNFQFLKDIPRTIVCEASDFKEFDGPIIDTFAQSRSDESPAVSSQDRSTVDAARPCDGES